MPVVTAIVPSPVRKGPRVMASAAAKISRRIFTTTADSSIGHPDGRKRLASARASTITRQNVGRARSFATAPEVP